MAVFSTSTVSVIVWSVAVPLFTFLLLIAWSARKSKDESFFKAMFHKMAHSKAETLISIGVLLLAWLVSFLSSAFYTVYSDHQSLVLTSTNLTDRLKIIDKERGDWKQKFETADKELHSQPIEKGQTKDRVSAVVNEKRCWLSNHFGLPNSTIKGAVTATAAIIHCNYRIEAPYTIQVEFDREFIPGATVIADASMVMGGGQVKNGLVSSTQVSAPALLSEQLAIVTVYGSTDQYPRAKTGVIRSLQ